MSGLPDESFVALVTGIMLAVISIARRTADLEMSFIVAYIPVWLYIIYILAGKVEEERRLGRNLWSLLTVVISLAVILLYVL